MRKYLVGGGGKIFCNVASDFSVRWNSQTKHRTGYSHVQKQCSWWICYSRTRSEPNLPKKKKNTWCAFLPLENLVLFSRANVRIGVFCSWGNAFHFFIICLYRSFQAEIKFKKINLFIFIFTAIADVATETAAPRKPTFGHKPSRYPSILPSPLPSSARAVPFPLQTPTTLHFPTSSFIMPSNFVVFFCY